MAETEKEWETVFFKNIQMCEINIKTTLQIQKDADCHNQNCKINTNLLFFFQFYPIETK